MRLSIYIINFACCSKPIRLLRAGDGVYESHRKCSLLVDLAKNSQIECCEFYKQVRSGFELHIIENILLLTPPRPANRKNNHEPGTKKFQLFNS